MQHVDSYVALVSNLIGHLRVPLCLCFKASLTAKPFSWKWLICMKMKLHAQLIFIRMVSHLDSFWNRETRELGNGLFRINTVGHRWSIQYGEARDWGTKDFNFAENYLPLPPMRRRWLTMQQFVLQYIKVALGRKWPRYFFFLFGGIKFTHAQYINRFDTAEIRRLDRHRNSFG